MKETADVLTRIREGALQALARHGLRKLSMTDVSVEAGVSRGTLYRYFTAKAELLDSLRDYVQESFEKAVTDRVAAESALDDRVRVVIGAIVDFGRRPSFAQILAHEPNLVRDFLSERFDRLVEPVAQALAPVTSEDRTDLPRIDPWSVAEVLVRLSFSYALVNPESGLRSADPLGQVIDRLLGRQAGVSGRLGVDEAARVL